LTISVCLILGFGGIAFLVFSSAKQTADKSFHTVARNQAERVEEWINTFLSPGVMSVRYLASLPLVRDSRGKLTSYLHTTEATTLHYANHSDHEQRIYDEFIRIARANDDYGKIFMANDDGQYTQAPEGLIKEAGYDPRMRFWYKEVMQSDKDVTVSTPYLTTGGGVVCSVMVKTRDLQGKPLGMLGVDYNLDRLTDDLTTRRILKTGYLVVFGPDGRIIVDGSHPEYLSVLPEDYPPIRKRMATAPSGILHDVGVHGLDEFIVIRTIDKVGWKIAVVFRQSEMLESSYALLSTTLLIAGTMFAITLFVLFVLARSIAHPIEKLIEASVIISSGAYENSDEARAKLQTALAVKSQGESKKLAEALKTMISTLHSRIEAANVASRAKSAFLSTMSHEIRTPMNAILGITEIQLQNADLDQNVQDAFEKIYASGGMLLAIINDILDLSKIEAGKLELVIVNYKIAILISDTALLNMMRIGSKPIEFEIHVDENLPVLLSGDELRVKQIFNNLLSNAFKYTEKGAVFLSVSAETGGADDEVILVFSVSDTGHGMTAEQVNKLFDEYSRFNQKTNRTTEGTGLGMSITRDLIRMMHGEIAVESEPDKGSTFTVRLPQGKVNADILGKAVAENLHKFRTSSRAQMKRVEITREPMPYGRVLIVDDVEMNILVAEGLISLYGINVESADSGPGAIEKIKNGSVYDIIFMDHMMPKMDGMEATRIIRSMGYERPIVALTANAVVGQADIFLKNGFDDFISKPLDIRLLNAVLNKLIRDKQPPEVIEAARRRAKMEQERLPIADS
jgi:signal transduction histidine kinase/FixJ family two-component response regulator